MSRLTDLGEMLDSYSEREINEADEVREHLILNLGEKYKEKIERIVEFFPMIKETYEGLSDPEGYYGGIRDYFDHYPSSEAHEKHIEYLKLMHEISQR